MLIKSLSTPLSLIEGEDDVTFGLSGIVTFLTKKLKKKWKKEGEIPQWYTTNSLQFFMDSYSYKGESVKSSDATIAKYLAKYAPKNKPNWWEDNPYTQGKDWEEVFFNLIFTDGLLCYQHL